MSCASLKDPLQWTGPSVAVCSRRRASEAGEKKLEAQQSYSLNVMSSVLV